MESQKAEGGNIKRQQLELHLPRQYACVYVINCSDNKEINVILHIHICWRAF